MIAEVQLERLRASCNALRSGVADSSFAEDFYACLCPAAEAGPATEMDAKATADAVAAALQAVDVNAKEESVGNNICSVLWLLGTQVTTFTDLADPHWWSVSR